jgi:hypothetical protein
MNRIHKLARSDKADLSLRIAHWMQDAVEAAMAQHPALRLQYDTVAITRAVRPLTRKDSPIR